MDNSKPFLDNSEPPFHSFIRALQGTKILGIEAFQRQLILRRSKHFKNIAMMKIQFKFSVLFLFFLFAFQSLSYAATITWTGDVSSEWFNAGNWSSTIPQPSDDVIIPAGRPNDPVVEFFTQIASMTVESGATVTIISSTLSINNASGVGLDNSGTINNAATINIQNTTDNGIFNQSGASFTNDGVIFIAGSLSSVGSNGILNEGTGTQFQNNNRIDIRQAGANALQNQGGAQFTNAVGATINIGQTTATISGDGIVNLSSGTTFTNSGTILIDKISNNGISNEGTFNNAANSVLNIGQNDGNIGANGILNFDSFINSGTINIDNVSNDGISNSINSDFNNTANATIDIGQNDGNIGDDGISNFTSFTNYGTITVDNVSDDGISNFEDSDFIHAFNGNLNIGQNAGNISGDGVANFGSFTNNSTIAIDNTTRDGIINGGIFNNVTDATINIGQNDVNINGDGIFNSTSASTFTNDGTIFIDNTISEGVRNSGTFNNNTNASLNIGQNAGNIGFDGILNNLTSSVFNNSGTIAIDNTSEEGLENEGDFNNASGAKINIGQHGGNIGLDGILNTGKFSQTGDTIKISNTGADGINNQDTLMNSGVIVIENVGSSGIFNDAVAVFLNNGTADIDATSGDGVENLGIFNNAANAMLNIGQNNRNINRDGIFNGPDSAIFMNSGTIAIDSTSDRGIKNVNDFTNAANGIINIGQYTGSIREDGISNSDTLTNNGTITIGNTVENGVTNEGAFNNTTNAILNIGQNGGNIDEDGFSNFGSFTNHGTIAIDNVSDAGISNQTDASFINASGANLDIGQNDGNIGSVGILNLNSSLSFTNNGDIQIDNVSGTGIRNRGDFSNTANATINIGQTAGNIRSLGIQNQFSSSIFMNNGTIAIDRTSSTGISNQGDFSNAVNANINIGQNGGNVGGSGLSNSPTTPSVFTNNGSIAIDKVSSDGVNNGGEFNNAANAMLNIGQNGGNIGQTGISNIQPSSSFMNDGTITIDHTSDDGIENFGNFNNTSAAILNIGQNGENIDFSGIFNVSSFTNSGILAIDNSATNGIDNTGEFNNRSTANINIGQGDGNISGNGILNRGFFSNAIFNNSGRITIDDPSSSSISGIAIVSTAQFIDTTGLIRIGQNHPFSGDVLSVDDGATFVGNDSTTIQCVGDFFIGASSTVSGIRTFELEGDWLNSGTFTANSSVVTILGTSQSIIGGNSPTTFFDLTINNSGDIVLENDVTLTRRLS
ncbi:MAG: hypothetical protein AAGI49_05520, partial [Bacteroidota bacterium]